MPSDPHKPPRDDVRMLGQLLGDTLKRHAGTDVFRMVERGHGAPDAARHSVVSPAHCGPAGPPTWRSSRNHRDGSTRESSVYTRAFLKPPATAAVLTGAAALLVGLAAATRMRSSEALVD